MDSSGDDRERPVSPDTGDQTAHRIDTPKPNDEPAAAVQQRTDPLPTPHAEQDLTHLHPDNVRIGCVGVFAGDWAWTTGPDGQMRIPVGFVGVLIDTWNGWAVFDCTRPVAEAIVADQQAQRDRHRATLIHSGRHNDDVDRDVDASMARMHVDGDAIVVDERGVTGDPDAVTRIEPNPDGRWVVMGGSWTWQAVDPYDCDQIIGVLPGPSEQQQYLLLPHSGIRVPHDRLQVTALRRTPGSSGAFIATVAADGSAVAEIRDSAQGPSLVGLSAAARSEWTAYVAACRRHGRPLSETRVLEALIAEYEQAHAARQADADGAVLTRLVDAEGRTLRLRPVWPAPQGHTARAQLGRRLSVAEPHPHGHLWQIWLRSAWRHLAAVSPAAHHPGVQSRSERQATPGQVLAAVIADSLLDTLSRDQLIARAASEGIPLEPQMTQTQILAIVRDDHREQARQAGVPVDELPTLSVADGLELGRLLTGDSHSHEPPDTARP